MKFVRKYRELIKIGGIILAILLAFYLLHKVTSVDEIFAAGGIIALAGTIFAETGLLIGFFLPGDTLLFAAGFFAGQGQLSLPVTLVALFVAAVSGNMLGYEIGRRNGRRLFKKDDSLLFHKENIDRANAFFKSHGGKAIIIARFVPVVRTIVSPLAGMGHMNYFKFMAYNVIGAAIWVFGLTLIGYWAGKVLGQYLEIDKYILPVVVFATLVTFGASFWHVLKDPENRKKLREKLIHDEER